MTDNPTDGPDPDGLSEEELAEFTKRMIAMQAHAEAENRAGRSSHPIIDFPRDETVVLVRDFGVIEAYSPEHDSWAALPVRLTLTQGGGETVELGPYDLGRVELRVLYEAIMSWAKWVDDNKTHNDRLDKQAKAEERKIVKLGDWLKRRGRPH